MNPFTLIQGRDYDYVSSAITCRVDRGGASVFVIPVPMGATVREVRVLAHNEQDAREAAVHFTDGPETPETEGILI